MWKNETDIQVTGKNTEDRGNEEVQITEMRKSLCGPVVVIVSVVLFMVFPVPHAAHQMLSLTLLVSLTVRASQITGHPFVWVPCRPRPGKGL